MHEIPKEPVDDEPGQKTGAKDNPENPWRTVASRRIYDNPWIRIDEHDVINPNGGPGIYGVVHFKNIAIGIVPIDETGHTWLVGQYRYPLDRYTWEIPEGGGHLDHDPLDSAKRELLEECGLKASRWELVQRLDLSNSTTDEIGLVYVARGLSHHDPEPTEEEDLTLRRIPLAEAMAMVDRSEITDSLSVIALLRVEKLMREGRL